MSFKLRLPATSANLGAAFDTAAVAMSFHLEIEAETAERFSIAATGRDAAVCAVAENNLILDTYCTLLEGEGVAPPAIALRMHNEIPLGMGCGSSAAGRLAAIAMAVHFGGLGWSSEEILAEACEQEGHPDNAAACWLGGLVLASYAAGKVHAARVTAPPEWRAMVVMPKEPVATSRSRAVLPAQYSRADAVANIQSASLLGLAFAQSRGDLLPVAMADRIHQPYRSEICPLLPALLPLAGTGGILGAALSGAGPSVLLILAGETDVAAATRAVEEALEAGPAVEILVSEFEPRGASCAS